MRPVWTSSRAWAGSEMNAWPENAGEKDAWVSRLQMEKESRRVLLSKVRLAAEQEVEDASLGALSQLYT